MPTKIADSTLCPFWSGQAQQCSVNQEGLFIPLEPHVEKYCTCRDYTDCTFLQKKDGQSLSSVSQKIHALRNRITGTKR